MDIQQDRALCKTARHLSNFHFSQNCLSLLLVLSQVHIYDIKTSSIPLGITLGIKSEYIDDFPAKFPEWMDQHDRR